MIPRASAVRQSTINDYERRHSELISKLFDLMCEDVGEFPGVFTVKFSDVEEEDAKIEELIENYLPLLGYKVTVECDHKKWRIIA